MVVTRPFLERGEQVHLRVEPEAPAARLDSNPRGGVIRLHASGDLERGIERILGSNQNLVLGIILPRERG